MDLDGCSLWNIGSNYVETLYTSWRKAIRVIWKLPFRPHCNLLHGINDTLPKYKFLGFSIFRDILNRDIQSSINTFIKNVMKLD